MKATLPPLIIITGPTATGKSDFAVEVAQKIGGEIISADSRQLYIGGDLCSGKITEAEMKGVKHYMISVYNIKRRVSVVQYQKKVLKIIKKIYARGKIPILCGGTGMYIDAVATGMHFPHVKPNPTLRKELEKKTLAELQLLLAEKDSERLSTIDTQNKRRLIRAIEISEALGSVPKMVIRPTYNTLYISTDMNNEVLKERIKSRLLARLSSGMIDEIHSLKKSGISIAKLISLGLEFKHLSYYTLGKETYEEMIYGLTQDIYNYAKRQKVWWKKHTDIHYFNPLLTEEREHTKDYIERWLRT